MIRRRAQLEPIAAAVSAFLPLWANTAGEGGDGGDGGGSGNNEPGGGGNGDGGLLDQHRQNAPNDGNKGGGNEPNNNDPNKPGDDGNKQRPEHVPEQFFNAETGEVNYEAWQKSWSDTRQQLKDAQAASKLKPPAKAEDYTFEPEDEAIKALVAPGEDGADDPVLAAFKGVAHKHGLPQEMFTAITGEMLQKLAELSPAETPEQAKARIDGEWKKLGGEENAKRLMDGISAWVDSLHQSGDYSEAEAAAIVKIGGDADGLRALEKMRAAMGEKPIPNLVGKGIDQVYSREELDSMKADPRYMTDAAFRQKVEDGFEALYGNTPAGQSESGHIPGQLPAVKQAS